MSAQPNCRITHAQIAAGACPYCRLAIFEGVVASARAEGDSTLLWNVARIVEDLEHRDDKDRLTTISNMLEGIPPLKDCLPILRQALADLSPDVRDVAVRISALLSRDFTRADADYCEKFLQQEPSHLGALAVVLVFYLAEQFRSDSARAARQAHILRMIEEMPAAELSGSPFAFLLPDQDGEVYRTAKDLWLRQVESNPNDTRVIGNAAQFFPASDKRVAGELLRRCKSLDPENSKWPQMLGHLYSSQGHQVRSQQPEAQRDWGAMGLAQLEEALAVSRDEASRFRALQRLPAVALQAGDLVKSRRYAEDLLAAGPAQKHAWSPGLAIHAGNTALGQIALLEGNIDKAKYRLLASVTPTGPGSALLFGAGGPNMSLAKGLLERGERAVVLDFLRRCRDLQPLCRDRLDQWSAEIERGRIPEFGPNLVY